MLLLNYVAVVSFLIASRGQADLTRLAWLIAAGSLASYASSVFNAYLDRDIDARMWRTRTRPIPSGAIRDPHSAIYFGTILALLSLAISLSFLTLLATLMIFTGMFVYVVVYTWWLKRRTVWNIVIGGGAGSFAGLAGWATATPSLDLTAWWLALLIFLWTPSHFWSLALRARADYARAGIPMLPVVAAETLTARYIALNSAILTALSLLLFPLGLFGGLYLATALLASALLIGPSLVLLHRPTPSVAWSSFKLSSPYLAILLFGMLLDRAVA